MGEVHNRPEIDRRKAMDFSTLGGISKQPRPLDPIEIFERLPNLPTTPNDIWRGQTEALQEWHKSRKCGDILIALNTGAGKTLAGLLIAQILVNEGLDNIIYVCSTKDLVEQTSREARKVGIQHTTRLSGTQSNDLFESGKAFCITTYQVILNGLKGFINKFPPSAIIFDDAHVAESMIRDSYLIRFTYDSHKDLLKEVVDLFHPHFAELNRGQQFKACITGERQITMMAAPSGTFERKEQLIALFDKYRINLDPSLKYSYPNISDHLDVCSVLFSRGTCEITPPFLPSLSIDIFQRSIRRVYLSATLKQKSDFIRAFGRAPTISIEPKNDAGNGERAILFGGKVVDGFSVEFANKLSAKNKTLVAVPSYFIADAWKKFTSPPKAEDFTEALNNFREARTGKFLLVSRVDGIDLPDATCRAMIIDGLPAGSTLLEKFQWEFLNMRNAHALRITNRLVQLFGRINRGRKDYGTFFINGAALNAWLNNDRNLALMPDLLQQQIILGRHVQHGLDITTHESAIEFASKVIERKESWLDYYGKNIDKSEIDSDHSKKVEREKIDFQ
ncbi:DEAD/DEAH box helicase family protein [Methylobacterium sp. BTF04]|uniref:DEAD/DEAH box helicase family protein n=1 Tax=Methylobacterium sp. BTF04 TaxID=2708300 RepID=UPI0013D6DDA8|nr:DEAD/DEAH box helicase family protein [Methylobacterium sp. BTF04]NEU13078.1 DEAD/DEAH box helicase family protein [Methylobacterium sp. BTF04]